MGFDSEASLSRELKKLESSVRVLKAKAAGITIVEEEEENEPPTFHLVDVSDSELDETQKKEKKRQRLLKAGYDARMKAKQEKEEEKKRMEEEKRLDDEWRENDFEGWLNDLIVKRTVIFLSLF